MSSKDPAFLMYSSDFLTGCSDLTMEERGQYITLLCIQHQKGVISKKAISIATPNATPDVLAKFEQDGKGGYFNARMRSVCGERSHKSKLNKLIGIYAHVKKKLNLSKAMEQRVKQWFDPAELIKEDVEWSTQLLTERISERFLNGVPFIEDENEDENKDEDINNKKSADKKIDKNAKAKEIISFLNKVANRKFEFVEANFKFVNARLQTKSIDDLKGVIVVKTMQWKDNPKQRKYLRPETLFNATKFQGYYQEVLEARENPEKYANEQRIIKENSKGGAKHPTTQAVSTNIKKSFRDR